MNTDYRRLVDDICNCDLNSPFGKSESLLASPDEMVKGLFDDFKNRLVKLSYKIHALTTLLQSKARYNDQEISNHLGLDFVNTLKNLAAFFDYKDVTTEVGECLAIWAELVLNYFHEFDPDEQSRVGTKDDRYLSTQRNLYATYFWDLLEKYRKEMVELVCDMIAIADMLGGSLNNAGF